MPRCHCSDHALSPAAGNLSPGTGGEHLVLRAVRRGLALRHQIGRTAPGRGPAVPRRLLRAHGGRRIRLHSRGGNARHDRRRISAQTRRDPGRLQPAVGARTPPDRLRWAVSPAGAASDSRPHHRPGKGGLLHPCNGRPPIQRPERPRHAAHLAVRHCGLSGRLGGNREPRAERTQAARPDPVRRNARYPDH